MQAGLAPPLLALGAHGVYHALLEAVSAGSSGPDPTERVSMRSAQRELLVLAALVVLGPAAAARAQDGNRTSRPQDDGVEELKQKLLEGEHDEAVSAAIELFTSGKPHYDGKHDAFIESLLRETAANASARSRRAVLEAIGLFGRYRVGTACRLARIGISDADADVRAAAANALAGIEQTDVYRFLADALKGLCKAPAGTPEARDLDAILGVIERKRDPIAATGVIVDALPVFENAEAQKLHASLKRLTGRSFAADEEWRRWYDEHKNVPQRDWYLEALKSSEDQTDKASLAAAQIFERLLASIGRDETALLRELEGALSKDALPSVRAAAIHNLGTLGSRPGTAGDRATGLLENLLKQAPKDSDETTLRDALGGLGRTLRPTELPAILPFVDHPARPVRLAAVAALGALRAEACVPPLVKALAAQPPLEQRDAEAAATYARSLGLVGRDPEGKSSTCLLAFLDRVQAEEPALARPPLLQAGAEALGGLGPALAPESSSAAAVVSALAVLSDPAQPNQDVRWWATTSLGRVPHPGALHVLAARVHDETLNVRRAAIGGIGLQARRAGAPEALVRDGISLLASALAGTDEPLKRAARAELDEVVSHDPSPFLALEALTDALARQGAPDLAAPFLDSLPLPDKIGDVPRSGSYWALLEARAGARLRLQDGRGAAADFELLLASPQLPALRQHAFMLGRAKATLVAGDHRGAAERAAELARLDPKDDAAWAILRQAADALLGHGDRVAVKEVIASVDRALNMASTEVQAGFQETLRRADAPPPPRPERKEAP